MPGTTSLLADDGLPGITANMRLIPPMHELEVKFYIMDLQAVARRLDETGARRTASRTHEFNLRFDTPAGDLSRAYQALRLRQDRAVRLTYKGPSRDLDGARLREEIEFKVDDFTAARRFLEALGYQIWMIYEKYRTTYTLDTAGRLPAAGHISPAEHPVLVTLDELPFGNFIEIEGGASEDLRAAADLLGLDWELKIKVSYLELFEVLRKRRDLPFRDLTFENFKGVNITAEELGVREAWG